MATSFDVSMVTDCSLREIGTDLEVVYYVSLGVFCLAALYAIAVYATLRVTERYTYVARSSLITAFVSVVQILLYILLLLGQGSYFEPSLGICVPWARWAAYTLSCTFLAYEIATLSCMPVSDTIGFVAFIGLTLMTGVGATIASTVDDRWVWYGVGFLPYIVALMILYRYSSMSLFMFVLVTWSFYPIILLLSPALLDVYSLVVESSLYLVSDLITKVAFGVYMMYAMQQAAHGVMAFGEKLI